VDLFCGIGGFRIAASKVFEKFGILSKCVYSCDIDPHAQKAYYENFGDWPVGDIKEVDADSIPNHDLLFAGFPCQPFSIIGNGKGFKDTRGTLFLEIARILEAKRPKAFLLENVKRLAGHRRGQTLRRIIQTLSELGYYVDYRILNALDYGLPQKRERVFIVGFHKQIPFAWPPKVPNYKPLSEILEKDVNLKYFASDYIRKRRRAKHAPKVFPSIWHENKAGNICSYPYSCALRAGASHNYLLVNGERRLTPREMLRLQGFPESFRIVVPDSQTRKQAGNAIPINVVSAILESLLPFLLEDLARQQKKNSKLKEHGKEYARREAAAVAHG